MSSLPIEVRHDWSLYTLFVSPLAIGMKNLNFAFNLENQNSNSLHKRIVHLVCGILLIVPILNTIIYIALRILNIYPDHSKKVPLGVFETDSDQLRTQIDEINKKRSQLKLCKEASRQQLNDLEMQAIALLPTAFLGQDELGADFKALDENYLLNFPSPRKLFQSGLHIKEAPALIQRDPTHELGGYYALFFLLRAIIQGDFSNREFFLEILPEWMGIIYKKRALSWVSYEKKIPYSLYNIPVNQLTFEELEELVHQSKYLESIKEFPCFFLELKNPSNFETGHYGFSYHLLPNFVSTTFYNNPLKRLGCELDSQVNSKATNSFFILKSSSLYYLMIVNENELTFLSSINEPLNQIFNEKIYLEIKKYLITHGFLHIQEEGKGKTIQN